MQQFFAMVNLLGMLLSDARIASLAVLLTIAAVIDCQTYRIPNWLTFTGTALGLALNAISPVLLHQGFWWAATGALIGLGATLPLYLLRVMGAGDVKLITMVGAFLGASAIGHALLCISITGGIAALVFALSRKHFAPMLANVKAVLQQAALSTIGGLTPALELKASQSIGKLPYGVSIAVGTLTSVVASQLGYF